MKFIIKNPAPLGPYQRKWGDFHFGSSLTKYLERLGAEVETHYWPEWEQSTNADTVLVLRGKQRYQPRRGSANLLWCISNPSTVSANECSEYDAACVASVTHAEALRSQTDVPVHPLLQCTDLEEFEARNEQGVRTGTVFVGNSRGVRRPCLDWAIEFGLDLRIYGGGWREWGLGACLRGDYVANEELPRLYAGSRMTLNDHWHDMMRLGYINNRIFDALAAGMIVISDDFPELRGACGDALLYYRDQASFNLALTAALLAGPSIAERQHALWRAIREDFSFERRAQQVWELASEIHDRRRRGDDPRPDRDPIVNRDSADGARLEVITAQLAERDSGRYCPLCATRADDFAPPGSAAPTNEGRCPTCGAASRDRLFWLYLVNDVWPRLPSDLKRLLHIAPDEHLASVLHQRDDVNYLSGDVSMPNVKVQLDLTDLQFPRDRFDLIICSGHLDRLVADRRTLEELRRVTKRGGYTLVQNPVETAALHAERTASRRELGPAQDDGSSHGGDPADRLAAAGFQVSARRYMSELSPAVVEFLGLTDQVIVECRKPGGRRVRHGDS